jgi:hypothetical protein
MKVAWPLMSLPLMFRTCRFLIIAIASTPAGVSSSRSEAAEPEPGTNQALDAPVVLLDNIVIWHV